MKQRNLLVYTILLILVFYFLNSTLIIEETITYTKLFITKLFPTSFLIYIISDLLINYNITALLNKKGHGTFLYITIMSMLTGFPSGPKYAKDLLDKKLIFKDYANYLIMFTHFPNPLFILGSVSTIKGINTLKLLIIIILSNLFIAAIFKKKETITLPSTTPTSFSKALSTGIYSSLKIIILIYGSCLFFTLIASILNKYLTMSHLLYTLTNILFDLTKGIFSTSILKSNNLKELIILLATIFGTRPIHIQIKSILDDASLSYHKFLLGRTLSTIIALSIYFILTLF